MANETLTTEGAKTTEANPQQGAADTTAKAGETDASKQLAEGKADAGKTTDEGVKADKKEGDAKADDSAKTDDKAKGDAKPAVPEKYELKFPEGVEMNAETVTEFETVAKELGLSQDNAQKLADFGPKIAQRFATKQTQVLTEAKAEWLKQAKTDKEFGGEKFDENLAAVAKARDAFAEPGLRKLLDDTGLGNHPEVLRWFFRAGKAISEDKIVTGTRNATGIQAAADKLYGNSKK